jgi:hypothetical protein
MAELARFVDQCNPDVLQQLLSMLAQCVGVMPGA